MFEINAAEAWDIDEEIDFQITDFLINQENRIKPKGIRRSGN